MSQSQTNHPLIVEGHEVLTKLQQAPEKLILVKFIAPYCPSCETLAPVLQQFVIDQVDQVHLVSIDMTEEPELAMALGVRSAPTVILFRGKDILDKIVGLKPKKFYDEAIQRVLS